MKVLVFGLVPLADFSIFQSKIFFSSIIIQHSKIHKDQEIIFQFTETQSREKLKDFFVLKLTRYLAQRSLQLIFQYQRVTCTPN